MVNMSLLKGGTLTFYGLLKRLPLSCMIGIILLALAAIGQRTDRPVVVNIMIFRLADH